MSASGRRAVIDDGPGGTGSAGVARQRERPGLGPAWLPVAPALVTLLAGLYRIQGPSFTRDETATLAAVHRTFPELLRMLGNVDMVHGAYYALIWAVVRIGGSGELAVRLPSAVAMAVTAAVVTVLGRRLLSGWAGLAAGLAFAALPPVSWFAEDAREGAFVAALATIASYCLVRVLQADTGRRRWLVAYGVSLAALGLGNLFGLLLIVAHAVTLAAWRQGHRNRHQAVAAPAVVPGAPNAGNDRQHRPREAAAGPEVAPATDRGLVLGWLVAVAVPLIVVSPVAVVGYGQLHQIHWIKPLRLQDVISVERVIGSGWLFLIALLIIACAVAVSAARGRSLLSAYWPADLVALCLPWLVLPPAILLLASVAHPVYTYRYIGYCIPAAALLLGAALAALGRYAAPAALIILVVIGLPSQVAQRRPDGHDINIRAADRVVARHERRGDALLNISAQRGQRKGTGERTLEAAYPYGLGRLRDVSAGASPARSGTLGGTYASTQLIRQRLASVTRLWVVEWTTPKPVPILDGLGFTLDRRWDVKGLWIRLYTRGTGA
ncbi:MAG TPA: glycosyltransferase family 39 protein [Streptosporangiaceae bacterium]|nr:glycosyltransferase family 39 protein [Streptosporangiaceae bacterium]